MFWLVLSHVALDLKENKKQHFNVGLHLQIFLDAKTYAEAESACEAKGGHLAKFDSEQDQITFR